VATGKQVAVPAQDRVGPHQQSQALQAGLREAVQQCGQPCPVGWFETDPPVELALQHSELMAEGEDLGVLVAVAARQQPQQRERVGDAQVRQSQQHEAASSRSHQRR
jgi:hypothetical protein